MDPDVEERRVQRLGTSSLIVTLPKKWVRRVQVKPGDKVTVVVEGDEVRIIPSAKTPLAAEKRVIRLGELGSDLLVSETPLCLYILGLRDVEMDVGGLDVSTTNKVISRASSLLGVKASCIGNNVVGMKVLAEVDEVDENLLSTLRSILRNLVLLLRTIIGVVEGKGRSEDVISDAVMLGNEIYKNHYAIVRATYKRHYASTLSVDHVMRAIVAPTLSQIAYSMSMTALDTVQTLSVMDRGKVSELAARITEELIDVIERLGNVLRDGDAGQLGEAVNRINALLRSVSEMARQRGDESLYIIAKAQDFLRLLEAAASMLACWLTFTVLTGKGVLA